MANLEEYPGIDTKKFSELTSLLRTDLALSIYGFTHVATLAENGNQVGWNLARVIQQELQTIRGRGIVRRQRMTTVEILDQQTEQAH